MARAKPSSPCQDMLNIRCQIQNSYEGRCTSDEANLSSVLKCYSADLGKGVVERGGRGPVTHTCRCGGSGGKLYALWVLPKLPLLRVATQNPAEADWS